MACPYAKDDKRICIIGAGPAGVSAMYHFAQMANFPEMVCYDKQGRWGGMWNYTWRTGTDKYGEPCFNAMYKRLQINSPKEVLEFPDYSYREHFGRRVPSYLYRGEMLDYMEGRWTDNSRCDLRQFIRFGTAVRHVAFDDESGNFKVTVNDLEKGSYHEETFTHVIVAVGLYNHPCLPEFPGIDSFEGRVLHARDFRDDFEFRNQKVLVIGNAMSGQDIAFHIMKGGGQKVYLGYKNVPSPYKWPETIVEKGPISCFNRRRVQFADGSSDEIDSVVFCTGYNSIYPFMENRLRITCKSTLYLKDVYKGCLYMPQGDNRLFYVGAVRGLVGLSLIDCLAAWTARYINEQTLEKQVSEDEMRAYVDKWMTKAMGIREHADIVTYQCELMADLAKSSGYGMQYTLSLPLFLEWIKHRNDDAWTYRDHQFTSMYTGD
ncbi:uncharacterized protein LOC128204330 [Mya arenaria]|uniref:uncharacterized protein LOC128204330 n=1 Tax=Mya arenaria TaxID=6604 RepID=UPI0022E3E9E4|nr:uncharacterized protein LOC128204330 [Mya arenaria]